MTIRKETLKRLYMDYIETIKRLYRDSLGTFDSVMTVNKVVGHQEGHVDISWFHQGLPHRAPTSVRCLELEHQVPGFRIAESSGNQDDAVLVLDHAGPLKNVGQGWTRDPAGVPVQVEQLNRCSCSCIPAACHHNNLLIIAGVWIAPDHDAARMDLSGDV